MTRILKKVVHEGEAFYSVPDAAKYLGTNQNKIRIMMGDGSLQWKQFKENGKLYITAKSLVEKQKMLLAQKT